MPVIVLALHENKVLIGTGGKWLMDGKSQAEKDEIAKDQRSNEETLESATKDIRKRLPAGCLMKPVVKKGDYFTTKFIKKTGPNPPGFIKGTYPDAAFKDEKPKEAAVREFEEETFTKFPIGRFTEVSMGSQVYKLTLTDDEADRVMKNWHSQFSKDIGELVNLKWVPIGDVIDKKDDYNPQSQDAIRYLKKYRGGMRVFSGGESKMVKTRSMTRRATRRSKSHCVGIKRSAVCKRTQGCKQASGPKRRFCRTAKNRKHH